MGSGQSTQILDPVRVQRTKPKYPPPLPPKWFLSDILSLKRIPEVGGPETRNLDWNTLERTISADQEDPTVESNDDVIKPRPSSGIGTARTDSGLRRTIVKSKNLHKRVLSFNMIDKHAKTATINHSETFTDLLDFLNQPIAPDIYPNTCLARALTVWFSKQNTSKAKYKHSNIKTPNGILQHLRHQTLTFTEAYTLLCRGAGIPTVIVHGIVKAGSYKPGDVLDDTARDTWCALHVDGSWQMVHPSWVCRGTYGTAGDGWVQIEPDEYLANIENKNRKDDKNYVTFNEEFFMPRPDVFIYRCYADNKQWHLIPEGKGLRSAEEFALLSYISPSFFRYGLILASSPFSVQRSNNGIVQIEIIAPKEYVNVLNFGYKIRVEESEKQNIGIYKTLLQENVLNRLVINYRSNDRLVYEIRLPAKGTYHFVVTGGFQADLSILCRFKLECSEHVAELLIPQINPGGDGWGPGPLAERTGLLLPNKPSGLITVHFNNPSKTSLKNSSIYHHLVTLNFQINKLLLRKFEYSVDIVPSTYINTKQPDPNLITNGELKVDYEQKSKKSRNKNIEPEEPPVRAQWSKDVANRQLTVHVVGDLEGEESVILIKATEMEIKNNIRVPIKGSTKIVCYYLLSDNTYISREPTQVKLTKQNLQEALNTNDIGKIETAISKCLKMKIPVTDDTVAAAYSRVEYLKLKRDMLDTIKRRNVAVLNETLCRVVNYRYREALVIEVEKLLDFRAELRDLQGYTRQLPNLREAIEELHMLTHVSEPIHNTIKCLCLLVGFEEKLKDWKYIRSCLKVTADTLNEMVILKRMEYMASNTFPWRSMDKKILDRVNNGIHEYSYEHIKHVNQSAATIYKWIDEMLVNAKKALRIPTEEVETA
ncbi:hypothetical protein ACF0H5_012838 [Mactra antiquata]